MTHASSAACHQEVAEVAEVEEVAAAAVAVFNLAVMVATEWHHKRHLLTFSKMPPTARDKQDSQVPIA